MGSMDDNKKLLIKWTTNITNSQFPGDLISGHNFISNNKFISYDTNSYNLSALFKECYSDTLKDILLSEHPFLKKKGK